MTMHESGPQRPRYLPEPLQVLYLQEGADGNWVQVMSGGEEGGTITVKNLQTGAESDLCIEDYDLLPLGVPVSVYMREESEIKNRLFAAGIPVDMKTLAPGELDAIHMSPRYKSRMVEAQGPLQKYQKRPPRVREYTELSPEEMQELKKDLPVSGIARKKFAVLFRRVQVAEEPQRELSA